MTIAAAMKSALDFVPSVVGMLGKKAKAKAKAKPQGKAEAKAKPSKGSKKPSSKKTKGKKMDSKKKSKDPEAKDAPKAADNAVCNTYVPGDYMKHRDQFIKDYIQKAEANGEEVTRGEASEAWGSSMKRALLLSGVALGELKRRRFVPAKAILFWPWLNLLTSNPF